uniref:Uncharacterized protein n=1 Tax=Fagus sylvatica TaxID=28930 RepID=A0A2N9EH70_FAGSY
MEDCFFLGLTVNTCWDDGVNSGCNNGSCREDVPSYFLEHEFVSSINFGFPEGFPFGLGESASGVKSGMLVSEPAATTAIEEAAIASPYKGLPLAYAAGVGRSGGKPC